MVLIDEKGRSSSDKHVTRGLELLNNMPCLVTGGSDNAGYDPDIIWFPEINFFVKLS